VGKPVILVPSPNVAEDHQTQNATALVQHQAALMIADREAPERLVSTALQLMNDEAMKTTLRQHCSQMAIPGSASRIVDEIYKLAITT